MLLWLLSCCYSSIHSHNPWQILCSHHLNFLPAQWFSSLASAPIFFSICSNNDHLCLSAETDGHFLMPWYWPLGNTWLVTTLLFVNILLRLPKCCPQLMLFLRLLTIASLFCGLLFPSLISLKYCCHYLLFFFLHNFKYLLSPGESHIYVTRRGSSLECHACNATCLCNSSTWMSHKHFKLNTVKNQSYHLPFLILSTTHDWSGLLWGMFFVYHWIYTRIF